MSDSTESGRADDRFDDPTVPPWDGPEPAPPTQPIPSDPAPTAPVPLQPVATEQPVTPPSPYAAPDAGAPGPWWQSPLDQPLQPQGSPQDVNPYGPAGSTANPYSPNPYDPNAYGPPGSAANPYDPNTFGANASGSNPYGQPTSPQQPYWSPPYGQAPYGQSPYPPAPAPYGPPPPKNTSAVVLTVVSGIATLTCCLLGLPSLIVGIVALTRQPTDPRSAARLARAGWITFGVLLGLGVVGVVALGVLGSIGDPAVSDYNGL